MITFMVTFASACVVGFTLSGLVEKCFPEIWQRCAIGAVMDLTFTVFTGSWFFFALSAVFLAMLYHELKLLPERRS